MENMIECALHLKALLKPKKSIIVESLKCMLLGMFIHSLVDLLTHGII